MSTFLTSYLASASFYLLTAIWSFNFFSYSFASISWLTRRGGLKVNKPSPFSLVAFGNADMFDLLVSIGLLRPQQVFPAEIPELSSLSTLLPRRSFRFPLLRVCFNCCLLVFWVCPFLVLELGLAFELWLWVEWTFRFCCYAALQLAGCEFNSSWVWNPSVG